MLPTNFRESYEISLDRLRELAIAIDDKDGETRDRRFRELQVFLRERVLSLTDDNLDPETVVRWRRVQTELVRSWRLLETEWLFLASARGSGDRRLATIRERLNTLIGYCGMLLEGGDRG
jgi:hypothetical protein